MTDSSKKPILTFDGKKYDIDSLTDDTKELLKGMQVSDAQLRFHEDTLKVLTVGRQTLASQLNNKLKDIQPLN